MISQAMQDTFNKQINEELFSAYLYVSMANYFEHTSLKGFAHWMRLQSEEELAHTRRFVTYLNDRGGRVVLDAIAAPQIEWDSPLAAFEAAYEHECHISACINAMVTQSVEEKDHASHAFLEWFVTEQVEEEANADDIVQQLKLMDGAPGGIFMMDRELAQRSASADPAPAE
ncbi:MAG: ferritin [Candidatus Hydrogenedentes bacterium]|nr:ferritin [Candidatus Hydrogenedentota bacterium]